MIILTYIAVTYAKHSKELIGTKRGLTGFLEYLSDNKATLIVLLVLILTIITIVKSHNGWFEIAIASIIGIIIGLVCSTLFYYIFLRERAVLGLLEDMAVQRC